MKNKILQLCKPIAFATLLSACNLSFADDYVSDRSYITLDADVSSLNIEDLSPYEGKPLSVAAPDSVSVTLYLGTTGGEGLTLSGSASDIDSDNVAIFATGSPAKSLNTTMYLYEDLTVTYEDYVYDAQSPQYAVSLAARTALTIEENVTMTVNGDMKTNSTNNVGKLSIDSGATLDVNGALYYSGVMTLTGTLDVQEKFTIVSSYANGYTNCTNLLFSSNSTLILAGQTNSGTIYVEQGSSGNNNNRIKLSISDSDMLENITFDFSAGTGGTAEGYLLSFYVDFYEGWSAVISDGQSISIGSYNLNNNNELKVDLITYMGKSATTLYAADAIIESILLSADATGTYSTQQTSDIETSTFFNIINYNVESSGEILTSIKIADFTEGKYDFISVDGTFYLEIANEDGTYSYIEFSTDQEGVTDYYFDSDGYILSTVVPEPSTYAMIFGALALGLAVYRRRK